MPELYYACEQCGYVATLSDPPDTCFSCGAPSDAIRAYDRLRSVDRELGDRIHHPRAESRGPTASELADRAGRPRPTR